MAKYRIFDVSTNKDTSYLMSKWTMLPVHDQLLMYCSNYKYLQPTFKAKKIGGHARLNIGICLSLLSMLQNRSAPKPNTKVI